MNNEFAKDVKASVKSFYEEHGSAFASTRKGVWSELILMARRAHPGDTIIDIGAGNGRFFLFLPKNISYIGIEPSNTLRAYGLPGATLRPGSLPNIPIENDISDMTTSFAVFHHLATAEERTKSVEEMVRMTKPGGIIAASAWFVTPSEHERIPEMSERDVWVPWRAEEKYGKRYVHCFTTEEWKKLWTHPDLEIEHIGLFGSNDWTEKPEEARNFFVIAKKKSA